MTESETSAGVLAAPDEAGASRLVREAFKAWRTGTGSMYDLMDDGATIAIPGTTPHCGAFTKEAFLRDTAAPFAARFAVPPIPQLRDVWSNPRGVVAAADATGTTRDGKPYANSYVFIFEMDGDRATKLTEYLDMAAFEAVWDGVDAGAAA